MARVSKPGEKARDNFFFIIEGRKSKVQAGVKGKDNKADFTLLVREDGVVQEAVTIIYCPVGNKNRIRVQFGDVFGKGGVSFVTEVKR